MRICDIGVWVSNAFYSQIMRFGELTKLYKLARFKVDRIRESV